jgi:Ser/Thr protein kinase RdoA (MazF antagonist)
VEAAIRDHFTDDILHEIMRRFDIADGHIHLLDGFESFMYEFRLGSQAYILRIGHSLRRSVALIQGEVDWINYLAAGGASVARAILSANQQLVECVDDGQGGQFLATAFVKAPGKPPDDTTWNTALFERYGKLIGRMHALSKGYEPPDPAWRRPEWDDPIMMDADRWISGTVPYEKFLQVMQHLDSLPRDRDAYGLVHQDAHGGNFFVDGDGRITLFDFDDCVYGWFIYDIAMVVFYAVMFADDPPAFTRKFMAHFLRGYRRENRLDPAWFKEIPYFLKLREIDLYAVIHRSFDLNNVDDPWAARFMQDRQLRIDHDVPVVDFNFASLAGE